MHMRLLAFVMLVGAFSQHSPAQIVIENNGFEKGAPGEIPAGWSASGDPTGVEISADRAVGHSGTSSLKIANQQPGSGTALSAPVRLEVGKIYRLQGWIRTENAASDPTSRYPTGVPATLSLTSFPFTVYSPPVGGTRDWWKSEMTFVATEREVRVRATLGHNANATGTAWFDDIAIEEVTDIAEMIPMETVRWFGPAFRYTEHGWTFVHIEGEPYQRGYQYGYLLADMIVSYLEKLAVNENQDNPRQGWNQLRASTDALMLRRFEDEYLTEMRGIADGAAKAGARTSGRPLDLLDIVTINSAVDLGQLGGALYRTPTSLTGRSFKKEEEEMDLPERLHKCSSFLANGPATKDGRIVFTQLFMWGGYTGVHWEVICDVVPANGHRVVYETFPGGIHSGADFYINDAGIMIGETTVMQTPFNSDGRPQSDRIRKAAQYASSIDDVVNILTQRNNGLYTNDWLIGDVKANEIAILLLGTTTHKLWRSRTKEFPGGTEGFYWSVNNAKDPDVRKEYVANPLNAPYDVVFSPVNRDLAFYEYYQKEKGRIDAISAVNIMATSPLNRPHACDGKVTTSEMAEKLVFWAHYGKVTLREKFPEKGSRRMPDLPGAIPHLTLGHTAFSPIVVADRLKALRRKEEAIHASRKEETDRSEITDVYRFDPALLWSNTVFPASDGDNWFVSGSAAYRGMVSSLGESAEKGGSDFVRSLSGLTASLLYTISREGTLVPLSAERRYDMYKHYTIPRIRGTFLLHQLRLKLGNSRFSRIMNDVHTRFRERPMTTAQFIARAEAEAGQPLRAFIAQWLERSDLPGVSCSASVQREGEGWKVTLDVIQQDAPYNFFATVAIETGKGTVWKLVEIDSLSRSFDLHTAGKPSAVRFNAGCDIPVRTDNFYTYSNLFDDFTHVKIVYGTQQQIEANHSLALRFQTVLADQFTEVLLPVVQDNQITAAECETSDLLLLGGAADNEIVGNAACEDRARSVARSIGLTLGKNMFVWRGHVYADPDDGLFVALPNPMNRGRALYCFIANSGLQLYQMTKKYLGLPTWAVFKSDEVVNSGYMVTDGLNVEIQGE